jgi:hypothetical protein
MYAHKVVSLGILSGGGVYIAEYDWPECYLQGGTKGYVFTAKGTYETAFFEAFPREPQTFIRGEGKTIEEAERDAWNQWQKILSCLGHEFEAHGYTNGATVCKHCGLFNSGIVEAKEVEDG